MMKDRLIEVLLTIVFWHRFAIPLQGIQGDIILVPRMDWWLGHYRHLGYRRLDWF